MIDESDESENDLLYTDLKEGLDRLNIGFDETLVYSSLSEEAEDYYDDSDCSIDTYSTKSSTYESDNNDLNGICPHCHQRCHAALGNYSDFDDEDEDSDDSESNFDDFYKNNYSEDDNN